MTAAILLLVAFTLLGYTWTKNIRSGLLIAPTVGLAATVSMAFALSTNFDLAGAKSVALAILLLVALAIIRESMGWRQRPLRSVSLAAELRDYIVALIPVFIILIPALFSGVADFFGVGNFDFFYNSQDGWFLASHSVNQYEPVDDLRKTILPLTWSANPQGRFAVTLVSAFFYKYFGINNLHFNAVLLTTCIMCTSLAIYALAVRLLALKKQGALAVATVFVLSAGYAQGYSYFLLGQISAIPLFIALIISLQSILNEWRDPPTGTKRQHFKSVCIIAFWLNALYIFYAILSFFGLALLVLSAFFNTTVSLKAYVHMSARILKILASAILLFLFLRLLALTTSWQAIIDWINLSLKTAGSNSDSPQVFTEYLTETFFALLLGVTRYPSSQSILTHLLGEQFSNNLFFLKLGVLSFALFIYLVFNFVRFKAIERSAKAVFLALILISLTCAFVFFASGSGYAIFKIGTWFIPICLTIIVVTLANGHEFSRVKRIAVYASALFILTFNVLSGLNYVYALLPFKKSFGYTEAQSLVEREDVKRIKDWLSKKLENPDIKLDFSDGIRAAWMANELRNFVGVNAYSHAHNTQPLFDDAVVKAPVCPAVEDKASSNTILITDHSPGSERDILDFSPRPNFAFAAGNYYAVPMSAVNFYASLGRGTYPSYTLSESEAKHTGLPKTFRWVEKGFELYVYSAKSGYISVTIDIVPGYVEGPDSRTLKMVGAKTQRMLSFSKTDPKVHFSSVPIDAGYNCFYFESADKVSNGSRYGALIRKNINNDPRLLNYAIGNLKAIYNEE